MKLSFFGLLISLFFLNVVKSQTNDTIVATTITSRWTSKNVVGFDISEIAFINWNAGGVSSISGLLKANFVRLYKYDNFRWHNEMIIRYGVNKQDGIEFRKTDDMFQFNSTLGYKRDSLSNWYHSAKFNFNNQFSDGYNYPNRDVAISGPFSPAYAFLGIGAEYSNKEEKINCYFSPLTIKNTIVLSRRLSNQGAFGVQKAVYDADGNIIQKGKRTKSELGILLTSYFKRKIFTNIEVDNRLSLYSDYINNFGNIDVDWQFQLDLIVNKYVRSGIGLHLLYDDNIKDKEELDGKEITVGPSSN
jgi:Protein of unknown function (DUF3078)